MSRRSGTKGETFRATEDEIRALLDVLEFTIEEVARRLPPGGPRGRRNVIQLRRVVAETRIARAA